MIAVTGATGQVGRRVAAGLAERRVAHRTIARSGGDAPVPGGYGDRAGMAAAFAGADVAFLIPAAEAPDRVAQHLTAVDAAVDAVVGHLVYLSFLNAAADATFTLARHHWATEEHVRASGLPFTFLRMSMYMDFLPDMTGPDGVIAGPAGEGRASFILRDDVAAAAVAVLADPGPHVGATYELTGPEALSFADVAAAVGGTYRPETEAEAYAARAGMAPDWEVEGWVTSYLAVAAGELEAVSDDVERLSGRRPRSLAEHVSTST